MGRKKKYHTDEERKLAQSHWYKKWYEVNKQKLNFQRMKKYYDMKGKTDGLSENT